jgi:hypothetical protein
MYGAPNYPRSLSKPSSTTHYEREEKTRWGQTQVQIFQKTIEKGTDSLTTLDN